MYARGPGIRILRRGVAAALLCCCGSVPGCSALYYRHQIKVAMFRPREAGRCRLDVRGRVPILHLRGTPEEMGRQYGTLMKPALRALSAYAKAILSPGKQAQFLRYARAHERYLPQEIRTQLRATAAEAGVEYLELVALNVVPRLRCTTLAVWGPATADGELLMGRNGDYFGLGLEDRGSLVVVYHPADGQAMALVSFLGMAGGFAGINARGVAFGNMLVFNAPGSRADGMPVQLAMRLAAAGSRSAHEMVQQLVAMKHAIPNNVMVADATGAFVAELGANGAHVRRGADGVLAAANDFREHPARIDPGRCARYDTLVHAAAGSRGPVTVERMKKALFSARMLTLNIQATVFEPAAMRMHVSINRKPAAAGPYETFDVHALLEERDR